MIAVLDLINTVVSLTKLTIQPGAYRGNIVSESALKVGEGGEDQCFASISQSGSLPVVIETAIAGANRMSRCKGLMVRIGKRPWEQERRNL
jgi:hypothetical protein